jgi:RNA polymerase sigma factor (TIGR02999 family)
LAEDGSDITELLRAWGAGDAGAFDRLLAAVTEKMRVMARRRMRSAGGGALDTRAVLHEAWLKLVDPARADLRDRNRFFALAAKAMRHILVDQARRHGARSRRGGLARAAEIVAVDEALARLESVDERLGRIVELRFFGGLSIEATAGALGLPPRTVERDWRKARAFLRHQLTRPSGPS